MEGSNWSDVQGRDWIIHKYALSCSYVGTRTIIFSNEYGMRNRCNISYSAHLDSDLNIK